MKQLISIFIFLLTSMTISAQSLELARQYFEDGEYEKAAAIYKSLWNKNKGNTTYLDALTDCYMALKDYDTAASVMSSAIEQNPTMLNLRVSYASLLNTLNKPKEAEAQYNYVMKNIPANPTVILLTSRALEKAGKPELAIQVLEKRPGSCPQC